MQAQWGVCLISDLIGLINSSALGMCLDSAMLRELLKGLRNVVLISPETERSRSRERGSKKVGVPTPRLNYITYIYLRCIPLYRCCIRPCCMLSPRRLHLLGSFTPPRAGPRTRRHSQADTRQSWSMSTIYMNQH